MSTGELRVTLPFGLSEDEATFLLAIKLYEVGKVSLGQAAKFWMIGALALSPEALGLPSSAQFENGV
jgi:hypothetical protein